MLVLTHYFKHHRIICQCMTHSLLKLETVNTFYVSQFFPRYHWLHWVLWTTFLCGTFSNTACALCSVTLHHRYHYSAVVYNLWSRNKSKVDSQKQEKTKHSWVFLRNTFLDLPCKTRFSGSGSYRNPMTSQLLINTTQLQNEREQYFLLPLSFNVHIVNY